MHALTPPNERKTMALPRQGHRFPFIFVYSGFFKSSLMVSNSWFSRSKYYSTPGSTGRPSSIFTHSAACTEAQREGAKLSTLRSRKLTPSG